MAKKGEGNLGDIVVEIVGVELPLRELVKQYFLDRKFAEMRAEELTTLYIEELNKNV